MSSVVVPWFRSPFTDFTGALISHQWYGRCADLELKVMDCFEAYGLERAATKCEDLIDDFKECSIRFKQTQRAQEMRRERHRQYRAGERSKEEHYATPPRVDSI